MTTVVPPEEFWRGVEQFNQQDFYACHDTLEALWMEASEPDRLFYQGILQIAVASYHLGNLNWHGAVILLGEGMRRLRNYEPTYQEINVTALLTESAELLNALHQIQPEYVADFVKQLTAADTNDVIESSGNAIAHLPKILRIDDLRN